MNASILLTRDEPTVDVQTKEIDIGWHHDGIFVVDGYPALIEAGGIVEVRYDEDDCGVHEIEVIGAVVDEGQEHPICEPFIHEIPDYSDDFNSMTTSVDTFKLSAPVHGDLDMIVRVDIDRVTYARTRICVRGSGLAAMPLTNRNDLR
jgi:hypothetical protein